MPYSKQIIKYGFSVLVASLLVYLSSYSARFVARAEIKTISSAINIAGRQRMLTQRILKHYAMIGLGIDSLSTTSEQQLSNDIALYNNQLKKLKLFSLNDLITKRLKSVTNFWLPYKKRLEEPVSLKNANWLLKNNQKLLSESNAVVVLLRQSSGTNYAELVNIAGRQRMLSQMIAKIYMFKEWGLYNSKSLVQTKQIRKDFNQALVKLFNAKENTETIQQALTEVKVEWQLFEFGLDRKVHGKNVKPVPLIVALMSEKILRKMNKITLLYENLSVRKLKKINVIN